MVLYDTGFEEIYRQMSNEREKALYYLRKYKPSAEKHFRRNGPPCLWQKKDILRDTHNTYLFYYYVTSEEELLQEEFYYGAMLLADDRDGRRFGIRLTKIAESLAGIPVGKTDSLQVFTGHFFSRYRERCSIGRDLPTDELIGTFAGRNLGYMQELDYKGLVLEKNHIPNGMAWGIEDGISLGTSDRLTVDGRPLLVTFHKTFLSRTMIKRRQERYTFTPEGIPDFVLNHLL